jgi:hypothetical protein
MTQQPVTIGTRRYPNPLLYTIPQALLCVISHASPTFAYSSANINLAVDLGNDLPVVYKGPDFKSDTAAVSYRAASPGKIPRVSGSRQDEHGRISRKLPRGLYYRWRSAFPRSRFCSFSKNTSTYIRVPASSNYREAPSRSQESLSTYTHA